MSAHNQHARLVLSPEKIHQMHQSKHAADGERPETNIFEAPNLKIKHHILRHDLLNLLVIAKGFLSDLLIKVV